MNSQHRSVINAPCNTFGTMNVLASVPLPRNTNARSNSQGRITNKRDRKFKDRVELVVDRMIQLGILEDSKREGNINILMKLLQSKLIDWSDIVLLDKCAIINHTRITSAGYIMYQQSDL